MPVDELAARFLAPFHLDVHRNPTRLAAPQRTAVRTRCGLSQQTPLSTSPQALGDGGMALQHHGVLVGDRVGLARGRLRGRATPHRKLPDLCRSRALRRACWCRLLRQVKSSPVTWTPAYEGRPRVDEGSAISALSIVDENRKMSLASEGIPLFDEWSVASTLPGNLRREMHAPPRHTDASDDGHAVALAAA